MAPPEAAQEGAQGGWRLDRAAQGAGRPPGAQHIGVVNAVAPSQRRRHQRHHLVARVRPPRGIAQVEALPDEFGQAEVPRQGGRKEQPGIGHQTAVVEGDLDPVGVVAWQHLLGAPFPGAVFLLQNHYPRSTGAPSCRLRTLTRRPPSVDSGLRVPFLGLIIGFPTWVSPFGGGCTTETGESEASFSVNFEMTHPVFGRTIGYSGRCRMSSS